MDDDKTDENAQTIRPTRSPGPANIPLAKPPSGDIKPIDEDYSDLATEEEELETKVADFKVALLLLLEKVLIMMSDEEFFPQRALSPRRH